MLQVVVVLMPSKPVNFRVALICSLNAHGASKDVFFNARNSARAMERIACIYKKREAKDEESR